MSHKSKVKCLSYHSEASLLLCPSPSPVPISSPQMLCIRKCKFPVLALLMFPLLSSCKTPPNRVSDKWLEFSPNAWPAFTGRRAGEARIPSRLLWLRATGCSVQANPSPSKPCVPPPKQQAVCLHSATFGMHEHGCREREVAFLEGSVAQRHDWSLPSCRKPLPWWNSQVWRWPWDYRGRGDRLFSRYIAQVCGFWFSGTGIWKLMNQTDAPRPWTGPSGSCATQPFSHLSELA